MPNSKMRLPTKHRCKVKNMSETKFLKNSTSFGNATADLRIKHAPEFSTLTIQPWPIVEPSKEFNITGYFG